MIEAFLMLHRFELQGLNDSFELCLREWMSGHPQGAPARRYQVARYVLERETLRRLRTYFREGVRVFFVTCRRIGSSVRVPQYSEGVQAALKASKSSCGSRYSLSPPHSPIRSLRKLSCQWR